MLLELTSILNRSIYQVMFCGCFIAKEYQYLNSRAKLFFFFFFTSGLKCAQEARLLTGNETPPPSVCSRTLLPRGRAIRSPRRRTKGKRRRLSEPGGPHCHPHHRHRCTRVPQKSSGGQTHSTEHPGSIASWDRSQKHLYPPCSLVLTICVTLLMLTEEFSGRL